MDHCEECGYTYDLDRAGEAAARIRRAAEAVAMILDSGGAELGLRPAPARWSRLEYGCHLRDVLLMQRERVLQARRETCPVLGPMGREERVVHDRYADQDPRDVARQLRDAAAMLAGVLGNLDEAAWSRSAIYNYPEPTERTMRWVACHSEHEAVHHLADVRGEIPIA